jgi:hypothetical protein
MQSQWHGTLGNQRVMYVQPVTAAEIANKVLLATDWATVPSFHRLIWVLLICYSKTKTTKPNKANEN